MRSGDPSLDRTSEYLLEAANSILDRQFSEAVFRPYPALLSKALVNGHRMWKPYYGGDFDEGEFELVEDMWDHEHCFVCDFKIEQGYTYWENANRVNLLCDECYEYYIQA